MDGNGRWAKARGLDRSQGHKEGVKALREIITACVRLGIDNLSAYAFSTENWRRPQREVDLLMHLFASNTCLVNCRCLNVKMCVSFFSAILKLFLPKRVTPLKRVLLKLPLNTGITLALAVVNCGSRA